MLQALAEAACGEHVPRVIEIGPGRGSLTRHLLKRTDELHAIELDGRLFAYLTRAFVGEPKLHLHAADALDLDWSQWGAAVITGNLPYYITSPLIEHFLRLDSRFCSAVFLVQWEVAQRLLASPGTRDYGYLTVATQLVCESSLVCKVPASAFTPPPKVESAAVKLSRRPASPADLPAILKLVSRAFAHKRKTLRNNLRPFYGNLIDDWPEAGLRAEQISVPQFVALYTRLSPQVSDPPVH